MTEKKFNLIDEPWIRAIATDGEEKTYSIKDIFLNAHEIAFIAGETELQNTAVLRLLIAISVTCFYRYDKNGCESKLTDEDQALDRYKAVWDNKKFPEEFITGYLDQWHEYFYLIGGSNPFYQVPEKYTREIDDSKNKSKNPTGKTYLVPPYTESDKLSWINAQSFNGEILQSGNSTSPFANKSGDIRSIMVLSETARWLVYYMNFADCSSKIPGKWNAGMTFTSSGADIHPVGKNLFESIMLCSVILDENGLLYGEPLPAWEKNTYTHINDSPYGDAFPDNIPELYTQQSRKAILHCEGDIVDGIYTAAGDKYGTVNAFIEPMFAFHPDASDKSGNTNRPNHIAADSTGWKEFRNVFGGGTKDPTRWIGLLFGKDILSDNINVPYVMTDISYGSMQCGVESTVNTRLSVNEKFFIDDIALERAKSEVDRINKIANILDQFGKDIDLAQGAKSDKKGKLNSAFGKKLRTDYEKVAGELFEKFLVDNITEDELHKEEVRCAEKITGKALENLNILSVIGHGEISIGKAECNFRKSMWRMKKDLGLISEEDSDKWKNKE